MSIAEDTLAQQLTEAGIPQPEREYRFDQRRRWRFDFAWPMLRLAVEVEGGSWIRGRHTTGTGFEKDAEKYNAAALQGWLVLRVTPKMVSCGDVVLLVREGLRVSLGPSQAELQSEYEAALDAAR